MNQERRALVALSGLLLVGGPAAADARSGDLFQRIARARAGVRTLQGPFTQTRRIGLLVSDVRSSGSVAVVRPDRLRWRLLPPDDVTFWVGPEGLAYRSPQGQGRLSPTKAGMAAALDDLGALIGGDMTKLDRRWVFRVLRDDPSGVDVDATARDGTLAAVRAMSFALAPDLVRPTRVRLVEGPQDHTDIEFGDLRINEPIDPSGMMPP